MKERKISQNQVANEMIYRSYKAQRENAPEIAPERWEAIFGDITELELRYQNERMAALRQTSPLYNALCEASEAIAENAKVELI
jgi:hypothetical protein